MTDLPPPRPADDAIAGGAARVLSRIPIASIGVILGACLGLALALVVGAALFPRDLPVIRALAIISAATGALAGFASANFLASRALGQRAIDGRPGRALPRARVVDTALAPRR